jgi:hypothetical protein
MPSLRVALAAALVAVLATASAAVPAKRASAVDQI